MASFEERRQHLKDLSDAELKERFWQLAEEIVNPILELGRTHTSPSIERSILLRMGFSSTESMKIVNDVLARNLIGKGAGHVIFKLARDKNLSIREAGLKLYNDEMWEDVERLFKEGK